MRARTASFIPRRLADRAGRLLEFVWSAWSGLAALFLLAAVWQAGHEAYGPFILSSPQDTLAAVWHLAGDRKAWSLAALTLQRSVTGFALVSAPAGRRAQAACNTPARAAVHHSDAHLVRLSS